MICEKSENMKILFLLSCIVGLAFCQSDGDEEHQHLYDLATKIMQNLQKEHIPSEGSNSGAANAPINHLHESEMITKTHKTKITVGVKGIQFVSVEANGRVVNISTTFGVGSVALYKVNKDIEEYEENEILSEDDIEKEIDETLDSMEEKYLSDNLMAKPNETKIIVAKKAKIDLKINPKRMERPEVDVTVNQGYVVAAKINVTKGYTDSFINY